ncbi:hypothetical protein BAUCODRAFT_557168 [Baudoinia panamericana UAMH 10762]|uniref:Uncharacterized protein n=1 Tax=Baudoinia panamericana (strain UAMH 10762) TaxID=717646 RepID=M2MT51_BAUPA|nr:uncharacterized protein BAUCODRAFT_557168 [Baudoinia panamericana UAMH 10762]EMC94703.1 hypothetical protein BAUCODRAFT_557168 [Baudoinia panamericana UAMH 10762]
MGGPKFRTRPEVDLVAELLRRDINMYRTRSFDDFMNEGINVNVYPAREAQRINDSLGHLLGFTHYNFEVWGDQEKAMQVRLTGAHQALVHCRARWVHVEAYLRYLPHRQRPDAAHAINRPRLQWEWWLANGKLFSFLTLPREIRDQIYIHTFGFTTEPYPTCKSRRLMGRFAGMQIQKPSVAFLRLNKQVSAEAVKVLYLYSTFVAAQTRVLARLLSKRYPQDSIRRLEIALSHQEFLRLFGFAHAGFAIYERQETAEALRQMKLDNLTLTFAAPSLTAVSQNLDGACQRVVVDWILEAAWPSVRGLFVTVAGYVKTAQKAKFETACGTVRAQISRWNRLRRALGLFEGTLPEYDQWLAEAEGDSEGGVSIVDLSKCANGYLSLTAKQEIPPVCRCRVLCTAEKWSADD